MTRHIFLPIPDNIHIAVNEIMTTLEEKTLNYEMIVTISLFMSNYEDRKHFFNILNAKYFSDTNSINSYQTLNDWKVFLNSVLPSIYKDDFPFGKNNKKYKKYVPDALLLRNGATVDMFLAPIQEEYRYAYLLMLLLTRSVTIQRYNSNYHVLIYPEYTDRNQTTRGSVSYKSIRGSALCQYEHVVNIEILEDIFLAGTIANIEMIRNTTENRKRLKSISVL